MRDTLVELWQCNSGGRYRHDRDRHPAPLDPNFTGAGRCLTDAEGRYRFVTIKPGAYPWGNHPNAWRPAHIHFSLFGRAFTQRLVTQMYFPGDPLFGQDPIFNSVRDPAARARMVCAFDLDATEPEWALAYRWDIVLRGPAATPGDEDARDDDAVPDRRAVLRARPAVGGRPVRRRGGRAGGDRAPRARARRRRRAGARRPDRDLAGRPGRPLRPSRRPARPRSRASAASGAARPAPTGAGGS